MNKYNIKELAEKLERCRNVNLDDVKLENVDEITDIKINRKKLVMKDIGFYYKGKKFLCI